jgi:hypothetical protein
MKNYQCYYYYNNNCFPNWIYWSYVVNWMPRSDPIIKPTFNILVVLTQVWKFINVIIIMTVSLNRLIDHMLSIAFQDKGSLSHLQLLVPLLYVPDLTIHVCFTKPSVAVIITIIQIYIIELRHDKSNIMGLWPAWIQPSLRIRTDWSGSMLFAISFSTCYRVCKRTAWILIGLRGCTDWSGSMLIANPLCWFCLDSAQLYYYI